MPLGNLEVGEAAPDFELPSHTGDRIRLSSFKDRSSVLIVFYPGDFTPICTRQLCSYTGAYEEFRKVGYEILGVGVDNIELHRKFAREKNISFPLLSDLTGEVAKTYGVWGAVVRRPKRAMFLVDRSGTIRFMHVELTRLLYKKADAVLELIERAIAGQQP